MRRGPTLKPHLGEGSSDLGPLNPTQKPAEHKQDDDKPSNSVPFLHQWFPSVTDALFIPGPYPSTTISIQENDALGHFRLRTHLRKMPSPPALILRRSNTTSDPSENTSAPVNWLLVLSNDCPDERRA